MLAGVSSQIGVEMRYLILSFLLLGAVTSTTLAQIGVYQTLESFNAEVFTRSPDSETLWLNDDIRDQLSTILNRTYGQLRIRYWRSGERTAWIFNEIGKERPITSAIAVDGGKIVHVSILEYRESRGGEVKLESFRRQFVDAQLTEKDKLTKKINGITGATLSVKTLNRSAIAALKLHEIVMQNDRSEKNEDEISLR